MGTIHQAIIQTATHLSGAPTDYDELLAKIGDRRFVLLGEASHGTHEFYRVRAELTKRLIREKGFTAIACEADWPDSYRVNRYVRGRGTDRDATEALADFKRFPQWMWRNADVVDFVGWLRAHNEQTRARVGFYGLDLYSLHASMQSVLGYLDRRDPSAAKEARARYACFDRFGEEPQIYGRAAAFGLSEDCQREVLSQLTDLQRQRRELVQRDGVLAEDEQFEAEQNARVVANAEEYYRSLYLGNVNTWNLRDTHMMDTLDALAAHLGGDAKIVVWAHNSHVGDAAATQKEMRGEINIGHLCRQRHRRETFLLGFSTFAGTVTAADDWDEPAERKTVRPALAGSYELLFHETGVPQFLLLLDELGEAAGGLHEPRLQRAIGVIYRPRTERQSHYFEATLPEQFDAIIHIDQTRALEPLERTAQWGARRAPGYVSDGGVSLVRPMLRSRSMLRTFLIGSLIVTSAACEDNVADRTENAAERVTKASNHLRHERRELSVEVAERADERVATGNGAANAGEVADGVRAVSREAGMLAKAQHEYEQLKALRVASLRAAHSVAESQPLLIVAISAHKPLTPTLQARLDDNLRLFRQRLAEARHAIDELAFVPAGEWERRDDGVRRQMAEMDLARAASWEILDDDRRDTRFPGT